MPESLETCDRLQDAVLWPATGVDEYSNVTLGAAVEIKVDGIIDITKEGSGQAIVDRQIPIGSHFFFGTLAGFNPTKRILQVTEYMEVPDLKGQNKFRKVKLEWLKSALAKMGAQARLVLPAIRLSGGTEVNPSHGIGTLYLGAMTAAAED